MKKLILLLLFIPLFAFAQTVVGDFKIDNGEIIWQKIYEDSLKIESQDLSLKAVGLPYMSTTFWLQDLEGGKLIVNHKNLLTSFPVTCHAQTCSTFIVLINLNFCSHRKANCILNLELLDVLKVECLGMYFIRYF